MLFGKRWIVIWVLQIVIKLDNYWLQHVFCLMDLRKSLNFICNFWILPGNILTLFLKIFKLIFALANKKCTAEAVHYQYISFTLMLLPKYDFICIHWPYYSMKRLYLSMNRLCTSDMLKVWVAPTFDSVLKTILWKTNQSLQKFCSRDWTTDWHTNCKQKCKQWRCISIAF